ncbi:MAG: hypothetical protein SVY53_05440 [Chloroflexota bacterium]|nr:hypothetical protein [Chloroflexota bacterium]
MVKHKYCGSRGREVMQRWRVSGEKEIDSSFQEIDIGKFFLYDGGAYVKTSPVEGLAPGIRIKLTEDHIVSLLYVVHSDDYELLLAPVKHKVVERIGG